MRGVEHDEALTAPGGEGGSPRLALGNRGIRTDDADVPVRDIS